MEDIFDVMQIVAYLIFCVLMIVFFLTYKAFVGFPYAVIFFIFALAFLAALILTIFKKRIRRWRRERGKK